jgi:hypothetical protein
MCGFTRDVVLTSLYSESSIGRVLGAAMPSSIRKTDAVLCNTKFMGS